MIYYQIIAIVIKTNKRMTRNNEGYEGEDTLNLIATLSMVHATN